VGTMACGLSFLPTPREIDRNVPPLHLLFSCLSIAAISSSTVCGWRFNLSSAAFSASHCRLHTMEQNSSSLVLRIWDLQYGQITQGRRSCSETGFCSCNLRLR